MKNKQNIRTLSKDELKVALVEMGEKPFRANQVYQWLWQKNANSFSEMTNLSLELRNKLDESFDFTSLRVVDQQIAADGTIKCAFDAGPGKVVEGVLIPTENRMTACVSCQVGCSLGCKFCATGQLKLLKNLSSGEILDQVFYLKRLAEEKYDTPLSNIVYMGMGEPLLNYKNVMDSIDKITSEEGLGMSPKRITVSTAGVAKMIKKLGDDGAKFNFAVSLHAANDKKRSEIMPINDSNNLEVLAQALNYFYNKTSTRVTFEYLLLKNVNDTFEDAQNLVDFCKKVTCKVNLIEYNHVDGVDYKSSGGNRIEAFAKYLEDRRVIVNVRRSRGKDIDAACGQLANKNKAVRERVLKP